jgi:hypothetical protein
MVINMPDINQVMVGFHVGLSVKPQIRLSAECLDAAFMSEEQIPVEELAWRSSVGSEPLKFFEEVRTGNFSIRLMTIASANGAPFRLRRYGVNFTDDQSG